MEKKRDSGYYWCQIKKMSKHYKIKGSKWNIYEYDSKYDVWYMFGCYLERKDSDFYIIDENIIKKNLIY